MYEPKYLYEIPDGCLREITKGCDGCSYYEEDIKVYEQLKEK